MNSALFARRGSVDTLQSCLEQSRRAMPDRDQMRLFLKGYTELCSRRRAGIDPGVESALWDIINELETGRPPSLENLLYFESAFEKAEVKDAHLRYLHCVLKGYRERQYRSFAEGSSSPAL